MVYFVGIYKITGQGLDDWQGNRLTVSEDILLQHRNAAHPAAGVLESIKAGRNYIKVAAGQFQHKIICLILQHELQSEIGRAHV